MPPSLTRMIRTARLFEGANLLLETGFDKKIYITVSGTGPEPATSHVSNSISAHKCLPFIPLSVFFGVLIQMLYWLHAVHVIKNLIFHHEAYIISAQIIGIRKNLRDDVISSCIRF